MLFLKTFIVYLVLIFSLVFSYAENSITYHAQGHGGAVAAEDSRAVEAGIAMLKNDGNATDAAVAVMLAASVVDYGMFSI
ncbi:MAG: gamma-glutamyltransferase, partial [Verrucomicrobiales bacterium]